MTERPLRFDIERPVEFRLTDVHGSPRLQGRTVNISSGGVLIKTDEKIGVGRKIEMLVRMAKLAPDSLEVDLLLRGLTVRSGQGWVAVHVKKRQILPRKAEPSTPPNNGG